MNLSVAVAGIHSEVGESDGAPSAPNEPPSPALAARRRRRAGEASQLLILAWCLYLLGSWAMTMRVDSPIRAVIWMFFACVVGLTVLWPVVRLSQGNVGLLSVSRRGGDTPSDPMEDLVVPSGVIWTDWICLMLVFQTVIWPLKVTAEWSVTQTIWLDLTVIAWTLVTALVVAIGCSSSRSGARALAMAVCVALLVGEPGVQAAIQWLFSPDPSVIWSFKVSPIGVLNSILAMDERALDSTVMAQVIAVLGVGLIGWAIHWRRVGG